MSLPAPVEQLKLFERYPNLLVPNEQGKVVSQPQVEAVVHTFQSHRHFFIAEKEHWPLNIHGNRVEVVAAAEENETNDDDDDDSSGDDNNTSLELEDEGDLFDAMEVEANADRIHDEEEISKLGPVKKGQRVYRRGFCIADGTGQQVNFSCV